MDVGILHVPKKITCKHVDPNERLIIQHSYQVLIDVLHHVLEKPEKNAGHIGDRHYIAFLKHIPSPFVTCKVGGWPHVGIRHSIGGLDIAAFFSFGGFLDNMLDIFSCHSIPHVVCSEVFEKA